MVFFMNNASPRRHPLNVSLFDNAMTAVGIVMFYFTLKGNRDGLKAYGKGTMVARVG
jgi:hypothetical protein